MYDPVAVSILISSSFSTNAGTLTTAACAMGAPLVIGSVKANIGHTDTASGIAGLIRVVESLRHRVITPQLHFREANPLLSLDRSGIRIATAAEASALDIARTCSANAGSAAIFDVTRLDGFFEGGVGSLVAVFVGFTLFLTAIDT